jgi:NTP pyrophosphatase (non-canonical NTP hydrolase)
LSYSFDQYESEIVMLAAYPNVGHNMVYPALGMVGESGEVAEKVKKFWRNTNRTDGNDLTLDERQMLAKEVGDVLWYASALSREIGMTLGEVAALNSAKLRDRRERNVIKSEGDSR